MPSGLPSNWHNPAEIDLSEGAKIYSGSASTRAEVRQQIGDDAGVGSLYVGVNPAFATRPNLFVKVGFSSSDTDWERVVTVAED